MFPHPIIGDEDPSAMRTLSFPERGAYDEKDLDEPVMWFVAPESIIQEVKKSFTPCDKFALDVVSGTSAVDMSLALKSSIACVGTAVGSSPVTALK
jgi:hypothetical protein